MFTNGGTTVSPGKPKRENLDFNGDSEYTVMCSVLHWQQAVRKYLKPHNIQKAMSLQYAYTHMDKNMKAWYHTKFEAVEDQHWEVFKQVITGWYLSEDHVIKVYGEVQGDNTYLYLDHDGLLPKMAVSKGRSQRPQSPLSLPVLVGKGLDVAMFQVGTVADLQVAVGNKAELFQLTLKQT